jgi:hypothetical protein
MIDHPVIRWLLGIEVDPSTEGSIRLGWEMPLAGWMWLVGISAALLLSWLAYTRMTPRPWMRRILTGLRAAALLLVLVLVARPVLEFVEERRESDRIVILADRSKSLQLADWKDGSGTLRTRDEQLRSSLEAIELGDRPSEWFAFSSDVAMISPSEPGPADGRTTDLPLAIDRSLRRSGSGPIGGLVLDIGAALKPRHRVLHHLQQPVGQRGGRNRHRRGGGSGLADVAFGQHDEPCS